MIRRLLAPGLTLLTFVFVVVSLGVGPAALSPDEVIAVLLGRGSETADIIVMEIRLPRAMLAVIIGATMGLAGAAMQGLLRNPLAEPGLFGAPQTAALFAVATISLGLSDTLAWSLPVAAILGAFVSVFLLTVVAGRNASLLVVILAGLAVSALAGAGTALALNLAPNPFAALEIAFWLLGSLDDRSFRHVAMVAPFAAAAALLLLSQAAGFRALTLGEDVATSLGVSLGRMRLAVIVGVALGVGASVAVAGAIGFIGLVAPHLVRPLVGHDPARAMVPAALAGAALLTAADVAARLVPATTDVKVGVLTALIGAPFFLALILRRRSVLAGGAA